MKKIILTFLLILFSFQLRAQLEPFGLEGKSVTALTIYQRSLFAVTDGEGVYRRDLDKASSSWKFLGLDGLRLRSVFPYRLDSTRFLIFVGVVPTYSGGDSVLVYRWDSKDEVWAPSDSGMFRRYPLGIYGMHGAINKQIVYAGAPVRDHTGLYKYENGYWSTVFDAAPPLILLINAIHAERDGEVVWIGGVLKHQAAFVLFSTNGGATWQYRSLGLSAIGNSVRSIAVDPDTSSKVYVGLRDSLLFTRDDGMNWQTILRGDGPFRAVVVNRTNPKHVLTGLDSADVFQLLESIDGGKSWQKIVPSTLTKGILALLMDQWEEKHVYVGTRGNGVFQYRSLISRIETPESRPEYIHLSQNYPNPFNAITTITYHVSPGREVAYLTVFDALGRKINQFKNDEFTGGLQRFIWDGRDYEGRQVPSGVYFYRLQIGVHAATRGAVLLR